MVTLAHTTVPTSGAAGCSGAYEYNGYIYWATESYLHRIALADADSSWLNAVNNWQAFEVGDADFHPMAVQDLQLFIGDGNQVALVDDDGAFNGNVLDINTPHRIKCMIDYELDLLIGTYIADTVNRSQIVRWDTVSPSWNVSDEVNEAGVNAFIRDDNSMLVSVGKAGNIYFYNGEKLEKITRVPGNYSNTATAIIHPGSVASFNGTPIFGVSNGVGNPTLQGIYSLGSYSRNYEKSLTLDWVISQGITTGIEIGAILVVDGLILVSWKHGDLYGIDRLDMTAKYTNAYLITRKLFPEKRSTLKTLAEVSVYYDSLPDGTSFNVLYSVNNGEFESITTYKDDLIGKVCGQLSVPEIGSLRIKYEFVVSGNSAPIAELFTANIS